MNGKSPEVKTNHACLHGSFMITRGAFTFLSMGASFSPDSLMEQVLSYRLSGSIFSLFLLFMRRLTRRTRKKKAFISSSSHYRL